MGNFDESLKAAREKRIRENETAFKVAVRGDLNAEKIAVRGLKEKIAVRGLR